MHIECNWLSLEKIHTSGQCFRWVKKDDGSFIVPAFGSELTLKQESGSEIFLSCSEDEFRDIWHDYFDLGFDYAYHAVNAAGNIQSDYLYDAIKSAIGVRILRQDLWETVVSFIISANNNIPRIRKIISALCEPFEGRFPDAKELFDMGMEKIRSCGTGFRDKYLYDAASFFLSHDVKADLSGADYPQAKEYLKRIKGVGNKVADCVCLFGLGYRDAFPRDVHIKRIESEHFNGRFPEEKSLGGAGILQQYLFYYEREKNNTLN